MGEENGPAGFSPVGQTDSQRKAMANYLKKINPYPSVVVVHTHSNDSLQNEYLTPLLGFQNLDGPSMQIGNPARVNERIQKWVSDSEKAGKRWLVNLDETGPAWKGVMPDSHDAQHDTVRNECLWGTLLAGGTGVEWYCGYRYPHNDLNLEDFRSRENWWKQSVFATQFVRQFPLEEMRPNNALVNVKGAFCLEKPGEVYLVYLPAGALNAKINLQGGKTFLVNWFNPRTAGDYQTGTVTSIMGKGYQRIGNPTIDIEKDWVAVIR